MKIQRIMPATTHSMKDALPLGTILAIPILSSRPNMRKRKPNSRTTPVLFSTRPPKLPKSRARMFSIRLRMLLLKSRPRRLSRIKIRTMADIIWVVVFLCVLIASCFGMYYFQGENKQKFVFCFLLVALSFGVLAFRLLDIAYTMINAAVKAAQ